MRIGEFFVYPTPDIAPLLLTFEQNIISVKPTYGTNVDYVSKSQEFCTQLKADILKIRFTQLVLI